MELKDSNPINLKSYNKSAVSPVAPTPQQDGRRAKPIKAATQPLNPNSRSSSQTPNSMTESNRPTARGSDYFSRYKQDPTLAAGHPNPSYLAGDEDDIARGGDIERGPGRAIPSQGTNPPGTNYPFEAGHGGRANKSGKDSLNSGESLEDETLSQCCRRWSTQRMKIPLLFLILGLLAFILLLSLVGFLFYRYYGILTALKADPSYHFPPAQTIYTPKTPIVTDESINPYPPTSNPITTISISKGAPTWQTSDIIIFGNETADIDTTKTTKTSTIETTEYTETEITTFSFPTESTENTMSEFPVTIPPETMPTSFISTSEDTEVTSELPPVTTSQEVNNATSYPSPPIPTFLPTLETSSDIATATTTTTTTDTKTTDTTATTTTTMAETMTPFEETTTDNITESTPNIPPETILPTTFNVTATSEEPEDTSPVTIIETTTTVPDNETDIPSTTEEKSTTEEITLFPTSNETSSTLQSTTIELTTTAQHTESTEHETSQMPSFIPTILTTSAGGGMKNVCLTTFDTFKCTSDPEKTIPCHLYCDGHPDCPNAEDEDPGCMCMDHEKKCRMGGCIHEYKFCDGVHDCANVKDGDYSDEINCECEKPEFKCKNGLCKNAARVWCNGFDDCGDGSDEPEDCKCLNSPEKDQVQFECKNDGKCIQQLHRCNGHYDCADESDEIDCVCTDNQFKCKDGLCLDMERKCDSVMDCKDGEDENDCAKF